MQSRSILIVVVLIACGREPGKSNLDDTSAETHDVVPGYDADGETFAVGFGDVDVGMNYAQLAPYLANAADTSLIGDGCGFVKIRSAPPDVKFMVEGRHLVRFQTQSPTYPTPEGIKVGDPESRIPTVYPNARRTPHEYNDGSYYIVLPGSPGDTLHRYVFETDGEKVIAWRAGIYPPVEYVEGCS